ncbi:MAG: hypothetical protein GTO24_21020 [candidate division Zixibacteria bacterium]|nr:hypothetical protein [candidate division Zixibacteria bacterium]
MENDLGDEFKQSFEDLEYTPWSGLKKRRPNLDRILEAGQFMNREKRALLESFLMGHIMRILEQMGIVVESVEQKETYGTVLNIKDKDNNQAIMYLTIKSVE